MKVKIVTGKTKELSTFGKIIASTLFVLIIAKALTEGRNYANKKAH